MISVEFIFLWFGCNKYLIFILLMVVYIKKYVCWVIMGKMYDGGLWSLLLSCNIFVIRFCVRNIDWNYEIVVVVLDLFLEIFRNNLV